MLCIMRCAAAAVAAPAAKVFQTASAAFTKFSSCRFSMSLQDARRDQKRPYSSLYICTLQQHSKWWEVRQADEQGLLGHAVSHTLSCIMRDSLLDTSLLGWLPGISA